MLLFPGDHVVKADRRSLRLTLPRLENVPPPCERHNHSKNATVRLAYPASFSTFGERCSRAVQHERGRRVPVFIESPSGSVSRPVYRGLSAPFFSSHLARVFAGNSKSAFSGGLRKSADRLPRSTVSFSSVESSGNIVDSLSLVSTFLNHAD
jgi:hypothetical protein